MKVTLKGVWKLKKEKEMATGEVVRLKRKQHIFHLNYSWGLDI